jgi:glycosyltransferase involved in cell wall biosynthesis
MIEVSVIVVMRNEEKYILKCIESIENQFDKNDKWELILVDGMSDDNTVKWAKEYLKNKNFNWKILQNPKKILASGWNIGIQNSTGSYVIRPDAHSELGNNYIQEALDTFKKFDISVVCVGGVLNNIGEGFIGEAIADLFSSKFGVGNSDFRTGVEKLKFTDTAVFGLYKKKIFNEVGFFDENLKRNQDIALHKKISKLGYKFITNPKMKINYFVRNDIFSLIKKAYNDGYWVLFSGFKLRHIIPFLFVLYLFFIPLLYIFIGKLALLPLVLYLILDIVFALKDGKNLKNTLLLVILYPIFHISYGMGTFIGFINKLFRKN